MDLGTTLLIIAFFLLLEGFFSGSELGIVSADPMKLRHMAGKGSKGARLALKMLEKPEWLLSTTLIGTNIAVVSNTTLVTALMLDRFGESGSLIAVAVVAPLIWIFGEIVPKSVFQQKANVLTPWAIFPLRAASFLFSPLLLIFTGLTQTLSKVVGEKPRSPFTLREEMLTMLQMSAHEKSDIEPDEQDMIRRLFDFSETTAREIMVPLLDVISIEQGATCGEATRIANERSHVRLPVYRERVDQVVGILHALELLGADPEAPVDSFIREIDYVPGSKSVRDLLVEFRQGASAMSVVVDEFGGAEGIVTIEDVMEEVVAELQDEFDHGEKDPQWIRKLGEQHYMVSGRVEVDTLQQELGLEIPRGKYASVAGFLLERVKDVPEQGEVIEWQGITFTIHRSLPHVIQEVRIQW
jgi:CBS domain containing-hemolysin-like protein